MKHVTVSVWMVLFCGLLLSATAGKAADLQADIAQQVKASRKILDGWQAEHSTPAERKLRLIYWTPSDREPNARYRERLSAIMKDIRSFYGAQMERLGFGLRTIQLEEESDGLLRIHVVHGKQPYTHYDVKSGREIREECLPVLREAGIDANHETIVIFCNMSTWDPATRTIRQNSPYYARGTIGEGTAWQVDSPILDLASLAEKEMFVQDGQYGHISLGHYNSIFIGGIAHELGHALGLPHCKERPDERAAFGTSLMGSGNRTYGQDKRGEGRGSFLTLAEGLRLAAHPMFSGSVTGIGASPSVQLSDLKIESAGKGFHFSGKLTANPPVFGVVAYLDPEGGNDYDATTATAVPDATGRFTLDCQAVEKNKPATLRLTFTQANGIPSGELSSTPYRYPYTVGADGKADISATRALLQLAPLVKAIDAKDTTTVERLANAPEITSDATMQRIARRLLHTLQPKTLAPSSIPPATNSVPLSDLTATAEVVGYGRPVRDRLPDERGLLIAGGRLFEHGLYAHADSRHEWQLDGAWKQLTGSVGLADGNDGSITATIEGDGHVLWESKLLKPGPVATFQVNLTGIKHLTLKINDGGDGKRSDWGVWLEPMLMR